MSRTGTSVRSRVAELRDQLPGPARVALRVGRTATEGFLEDEGLGVAAELAYRFFLALVPFLIFLTAISGFIAAILNVPDTAQRLVGLVSTTVPENVGAILAEQLRRILEERQPGVLSVSLLFTLFAATGATNALIKTMNRAYDVAESRPFVKRYLVALLLTLLAAGSVIVSFVLLMVVRFFTSALADLIGLGAQYQALAGLLPLPLVIFALVIGAGVLYWRGPNKRVAPRSIIPGAILFAIGWLLATYGFSLYVGTLGNYEATYGALGSVVVLLIWLYITGAILLAGAELNAAISKVTLER